MPTKDEMSIDERRTYLKRMKARYLKASRKERSQLLSEMEQMTGMHRKSLTRLLHGANLERRKRKTARKPSYGAEVEAVIVQIWESLDYICAERLTPILPTMAQHLARFAVVKLTEDIEAQLKTISRATVSRLLRRVRSRHRRLPRDRSRTSQPGDQRGSHGTDCLGDDRAWPLRGGSGVSQRGQCHRRAWPYHSTSGCGDGME